MKTYPDEPVNGLSGITKREWLAGHAMAGLLAADLKREVEPIHIAAWSVQQADGLIEALNEERTDAAN